ncbi:OsmC family protein [Thermococcus sp.]|uniref:OsmC family protein n=1 Tax=Thermococcus sp. TaxID=35749 RepID=UPI00262B0D22|nr:OsmC family protein [Thermococcus sp.]
MARYKDMKIAVSGKRIGPTKMVVKAGDFEITVDKLGGEAPSPLDYILAALAGCMNIVGTLVAKDMKINIEDIDIEIEGTFNPGKLYGNGSERAGYKDVTVRVKVRSDADEKTLREWLERVEERCPVSDNLANVTPTLVRVEKL